MKLLSWRGKDPEPREWKVRGWIEVGCVRCWNKGYVVWVSWVVEDMHLERGDL